MKIEERMSLTYDDISIIPTWSGINSRADCELYTNIGEYSLATPLVLPQWTRFVALKCVLNYPNLEEWVFFTASKV